MSFALLGALAFGPANTVGIALLLLAIAAVSSVPFSPLPPLAQSLGEVVLAAGLIGAVGQFGTTFLPYLVVPALVVGVSQGIRLGLIVALVGDATLFVTSLAVGQPGGEMSMLVPYLQWSLMALAVAALAGWLRRIRQGDLGAPDPAYAEAHRLLSELHSVTGQLSLGLDTPTLAIALCDDLEPITGSLNTMVVVRGKTGLFHRLTGSGVISVAAVELEEAWLSSAPVVTTADGTTHLLLPVRMGERVVALAVSTLDAGSPVTPRLLSVATKIGDRSGSRLASAMLFDDVRHLATQDERLRLARDIHDGVAQDIASLGFFVDDAMHGADEATHAKLLTLRAELKRIVGELRLSIFDLRLGADEAITLAAAISDHAHRVGTLGGLKVHVSVDESGAQLTSGAEHDLMRIAQEAITNVRRHAHAANVWVECLVDAPSFVLRVQDDGLGLGPSTDVSMGLRGIRERTARLGASVVVQDRPGGGTVVEVTSRPAPQSPDALRLRAEHV